LPTGHGIVIIVGRSAAHRGAPPAGDAAFRGCGMRVPRGEKEIGMKEKVHPVYKPTKITCHCGNVIETSSTVENIHVEICSSCHPFFTGKQKLVDSTGRVERFRTKYKYKDTD